MPSSRRPPDNTSRVAASLASMAGWWKSLHHTSDAMRNVVVASAAAIMAGVVANWSRRWSATDSVAYPRSSAFRANATHAWRSVAAEACRPNRKRWRGRSMGGDGTALRVPPAMWSGHR